MNGVNGWLVAIIVVLVGALMYVMGQQSGQEGGDLLAELLDDSAEEASEATEAAANEAPAAPAAAAKRNVRIGTRGAGASACQAVAVVANLPGTGGVNDFLAVREAPTTRGTQVDKLGAGHPVVVCDQSDSGSWIGIVYQNDGMPPRGRCGVVDSVASSRAYSGPCQSGWVYSRYLEVLPNS
jgi:hypothetical protein